MDAQKLYTLEEHIRPAMLTGAPQDRDKKRAEILRANTSGIHRKLNGELKMEIENYGTRIARDLIRRFAPHLHSPLSILHYQLFEFFLL